jgi:hypothetical protein
MARLLTPTLSLVVARRVVRNGLQASDRLLFGWAMNYKQFVHAAPTVLLIGGVAMFFFGFNSTGKFMLYGAAIMQVWSVVLSATWLRKKRRDGDDS